MPDDVPTPQNSPPAEAPAESSALETSGEEIGLLGAEAAVVSASVGQGEAPSRALGPLRSVPAALWPDISGIFFPEPYVLDFEWHEGVPESVMAAREMVEEGAGGNGAAGQPALAVDEGDESPPISLQTGDLELVDDDVDAVDDEAAFFEDAEPTIEMEVDAGLDDSALELEADDLHDLDDLDDLDNLDDMDEIAEVEATVEDAGAGDAIAGDEAHDGAASESERRPPPDSIQPIDDAEIEEIVEVGDEPAEHEVVETLVERMADRMGAAPPPRPQAPPTHKTKTRATAKGRSAPPLPPDATGQHAPSAAVTTKKLEAVSADDAKVMPFERVRPFRKLQGPRPTMSQPNLIEAALGLGDPSASAMSGKAKPWYEAIFDESIFNFLPKTLHRQTRRQAKFIHESLRLGDGARVLDVACGFGRHCIELTKRGYQLTGLDLSASLIEKARQEAARRKMDIELVCADMRELTYEREFDGALLMGHSFGYFDDQTNVEVLGRIRQALKPRGRFLLHTLNRDRVIRELPEVIWWRGQDALVLEEIEFDPETSRMQSKRTVVFDDGRPPWEQYIEVRLYSLHEIYTILEEVGFRIADVSGSLHYRGVFFPNESRDLLLLVERERDLI